MASKSKWGLANPIAGSLEQPATLVGVQNRSLPLSKERRREILLWLGNNLKYNGLQIFQRGHNLSPNFHEAKIYHWPGTWLQSSGIQS